jgi:ATP diphosphatase
LLEEAHEVADALDHQDWQLLREELGDLLFQLCFLIRLAQESGLFGVSDVIEGSHRKMVDRHPHVFGAPPAGGEPTADEVAAVWAERKLAEAGKRGASILDGVPRSLPALTAAYRLGQKAAGLGFDWADTHAVFDKVSEELDELSSALAATGPPATDGLAATNTARIEEELGDVFFSLASLSRHLRLDPERCLARANIKFRRRFAAVEAGLAQSSTTNETERRQQMEELWDAAKLAER